MMSISARFAKDQLKTIRKKNGFVVLDSQSPSDAIKHPHSRTLIEQTPTKICFPNPDATMEDYANRCGTEFNRARVSLDQARHSHRFRACSW